MARQRNERNAFLFHVRDNCHAVAGGGAADDEIHFIVFDQALDEVDCVLGVAAGIVVDQFEFPALDAAFGVDVLNVHLQGFQFGIAQERSGAGYGQERADPDRFSGAGEVDAGEQQRGRQCGFPQRFHVDLLPRGDVLCLAGANAGLIPALIMDDQAAVWRETALT